MACWFQKAAKLAHSGAQDKLAYPYLHGYVVEADLAQFYTWHRIAAENGIFLALEVRENIKNKMTTEERLLSDLLSREYIKKYRKNIH